MRGIDEIGRTYESGAKTKEKDTKKGIDDTDDMGAAR